MDIFAIKGHRKLQADKIKSEHLSKYFTLKIQYKPLILLKYVVYLKNDYKYIKKS